MRISWVMLTYIKGNMNVGCDMNVVRDNERLLDGIWGRRARPITHRI